MAPADAREPPLLHCTPLEAPGRAPLPDCSPRRVRTTDRTVRPTMELTFDSLVLIAIIAFAVAAFAFEWRTIDLVAFTALGLVLLFDLVTPAEAISGFSNPAVITIMMMFVLSESLVRSGLITRIGYRIADSTGGSKWGGSVLLLGVAGVISAFLNNTAAVSVFMPVAIHLAKHFRFSPSKILMPLSFTAILAGTCTLIGTSTNLLVSSLAVEHGLEPFSMFEFLYLGGALFLAGSTYNLLILMRVLPSRAGSSSLTQKYALERYLTELKVPADSKLIGHTVLDEHLAEQFHLTVLEILRGASKISTDLRNTKLQVDDILIVQGVMSDILALKEQKGLLLLTDIKLEDEDLSDDNTVLAEVQHSPLSRFIGSTLKEIDFRRRFGCFVLALSRTGEVIRDKIALIPLKAWDTLLVFGPRAKVDALFQRDDFLHLGELDLRLRLSRRWWLSALLIPLAVALAATGVMSILKASILGVVVLLVTRQLNMRQAYMAIDWSVIFLLAATVPLGLAMENTGLADAIGSWIVRTGTSFGPIALLSLMYLATTILTNVFSNSATAILMVPIAFSTAGQLGIDPKPLLMAVTYAASASFMTPVGYQTNAMVYGPGNYRFTDFLLFGGPLQILAWLLATALIPVIWPF